MTKPLIRGFVSNSNYYSFDGSNENLTLVGGNIRFGKTSTLSAGAGLDINAVNGVGTNVSPALELKYKQNIGDNFNAQFRFREIDGVEQYRVTFGGSYNIDKNNSIYAAAHFTSKYDDKFSHKAGGWLGYTHTFNNGVSVSGELQQNFNIGKKTDIFALDGNKSLNVMVSIPLGR